MRKFYDTNAVIELQDKILDEFFYISSITLEELEDIKSKRYKDDSTKYACRKAIHILDEHPDCYEVIIYNEEIKKYITDRGLEDNMDNRICACAYSIKNDVLFVSYDICCRTIAKEAFDLNVMSASSIKDNIYKGYKVIEGNTEYINNMMVDIKMDINEYLIIKNTDDGSCKEMRWDGNTFLPLKLPPSKYVKAKNELQRCALDMLMNNDITICAVLGGFGSGKSYLATKMALYSVTDKGYQSKILGVRSPQGEGVEIGFLAGDFIAKTDEFFKPLAQQLDGGEFELESLRQRGLLETQIPYYMKGTTYDSTIILIDEAEDLDEKGLKLVGTRVGVGSRIFLDGDYKQSVINASTNNALVKMCESFRGNPKFACIYLGEDVRSTTSKMFADLFD